MGTRYGPWIGVPAYAAAAFTAYSRVWADAHFANDVVAGFGLAVLTNMALVNPQDETIRVTPAILGDDVPGIRFNILDPDEQREGSVARQRRKYADFEPQFRLRLDTGLAYLRENSIQSPKGAGTEFDLDDFRKNDDPTVVAVANVDYFINRNHSITAAFTPFESRDTGQFATPVNFGGVIFPANSETSSSYRVNELRGIYNYTFDTGSKWEFSLGGGAHFQTTDIKLRENSTGKESVVEESFIIPVLHANIGYRLGHGFTLKADFEGITLPDDTLVELTAAVKYDITPRWETELYVGYASRDFETSELKNKYEYELVGFSFAYKL